MAGAPGPDHARPRRRAGLHAPARAPDRIDRAPHSSEREGDPRPCTRAHARVPGGSAVLDPASGARALGSSSPVRTGCRRRGHRALVHLAGIASRRHARPPRRRADERRRPTRRRRADPDGGARREDRGLGGDPSHARPEPRTERHRRSRRPRRRGPRDRPRGAEDGREPVRRIDPRGGSSGPGRRLLPLRRPPRHDRGDRAALDSGPDARSDGRDGPQLGLLEPPARELFGARPDLAQPGSGTALRDGTGTAARRARITARPAA